MRYQMTKDLDRWLAGVVILAGEGSIDISSKAKVWIAIVHDGGGFSPGAAIVAADYGSGDEALERAVELLEEKTMEDTEYIEELEKEWRESWREILTERWDGRVWGLSSSDAAKILKNDKSAAEVIYF